MRALHARDVPASYQLVGGKKYKSKEMPIDKLGDTMCLNELPLAPK